MRAWFQGKSGSKRKREKEILDNSLKALEESQEATEEQKGIVGELSSAFTQTSGRHSIVSFLQLN